MLNKIKLLSENSYILSNKKIGRNNYWKLDNGKEITTIELVNQNVLIQCHNCNEYANVKMYFGSNGLVKRKYLCFSCVKKGVKNSFYGKKHTMEFKNRLSKERKGVWYVGNKNPMYGKSYFDWVSEDKKKEICSKISNSLTGEKNGFYGKHHSQKTKDILRNKTSDYMRKHPDHMANMTRKSLDKQSKGFRSSIEKIVKQELDHRNVKHKYSKILHRKYQFDYLINDDIILEVNGDYWHGNPVLYGDGKRPLNNTQRFKIFRDKEKKEFAEQHGYKVFYIWESEIKNNDFVVLDKIVEVINAHKI